MTAATRSSAAPSGCQIARRRPARAAWCTGREPISSGCCAAGTLWSPTTPPRCPRACRGSTWRAAAESRCAWRDESRSRSIASRSFGPCCSASAISACAPKIGHCLRRCRRGQAGARSSARRGRPRAPRRASWCSSSTGHRRDLGGPRHPRATDPVRARPDAAGRLGHLDVDSPGTPWPSSRLRRASSSTGRPWRRLRREAFASRRLPTQRAFRRPAMPTSTRCCRSMSRTECRVGRRSPSPRPVSEAGE